MLYIKAMKPDTTYQLLEAEGYVEFIKKGDSVEVVYNYTDLHGALNTGRHWLEGDVYIMNESGHTVSTYTLK